MKMEYLYIKVRYNTFDRFEIETKPDVKGAGKIRRVIAWFFLSNGLAILFGTKGYTLSINGERKDGDDE